MKESWGQSENSDIRATMPAKQASATDFSRFQKSSEIIQRNVAIEQMERAAELAGVDPSGELFSNRPAILAMNDSNGNAVPESYRFDAKQEYSRKAREALYANLGIDPLIENNGWEKRFLK